MHLFLANIRYLILADQSIAKDIKSYSKVWECFFANLFANYYSNNYPKNLPEQFYSLYDKLNGDFWTRKDELKQDIEEINDPEYSVEELNDEYVIVTDPEDDMHALQIFNGGTERTYVLDFDRIRYL